MENPEGIAINNDLDPPVMYIVTDPSSPHGKQYISAFFAFTKPEEGTGLTYYNKDAPSPSLVPCDGCDEVFGLAEALSSAFISSYEVEEEGVNVTTAVLSSILPFVALCMIVIIAVTVLIVFRKKKANRSISSAALLDESENDVFSNTEHPQKPTGFDRLVSLFRSSSQIDSEDEDSSYDSP